MTWKLQGPSQIMSHDEELVRIIFSDITYVDGKPQQSVVGKAYFKANVQPLKGRDLLLVPEHQRFIEQYWCFTQKDFYLQTGEIIHRGEVHFQVQEVEHWGSYQKLRIMRVDVGANQTP